MRIIAGKWKGHKVFPDVSSMPTRPTTDRVREALFNKWHHEFDWRYTNALDLFAGTGLVSLEFLSRGVPKVYSVDQDPLVISHLQAQQRRFEAEEYWSIYNQSVDVFLKMHKSPYALIFADPPYDWPHVRTLPDMIFEGPGLLEQGQLAIEHDKLIDFDAHPRFLDVRNYGRTKLSFFE
ncbi:MAG: 16S rRNA (guanine(966)-N(2))-methyltransferase RsmD [Bacteroidetes bacterium]|jgi:16S rRNA (guanine(966)-N(2))-methyltransferase RsmD|nr:16S rRNA (guanine(966)-N(2))-methyltransferase RsmD [Bacteroidota bacterium]